MSRIDPDRFAAAVSLATTWCRNGSLPAIAMQLTVGQETTGPVLIGKHSPEEDAPLPADAIFLIASITKPVVAMGVMRLVECGLIGLDDRVEEVVPEFGRSGTHQVTLRHLLTHTSGLPDMLPDNRELRAAKSGLDAFVAGACRVDLAFPPGRGVSYQSMGFALLGEVIARVSGFTAARFLDREFLQPLGLADTALGAPDAWFTGDSPKVNRIAGLRLPDDMRETDWHWNTRYWRQLGAPWGGLLTTPADLSRLASLMLASSYGPRSLLAPATIAAMTRNQLACFPDLPEAERRCRPWGLGWRLNWPGHSANFGDLLGPNTFGHWGATGTLLWIDPDKGAIATILTTQPQEPRGSYLARLSNTLAAAISD